MNLDETIKMLDIEAGGPGSGRHPDPGPKPTPEAWAKMSTKEQFAWRVANTRFKQQQVKDQAEAFKLKGLTPGPTIKQETAEEKQKRLANDSYDTYKYMPGAKADLEGKGKESK